MPRVLLLLPTTTYRTHDFLKAAEKLGVDIVVASEEPSTMEGLQPGRLLTLNFLDPGESARRVRAFAEDYPIDSVVPVDEETSVVAAAITRNQNDHAGTFLFFLSLNHDCFCHISQQIVLDG